MREDILDTKLKKLDNLKNSGMDVYPDKTQHSMANREALDKFSAKADPPMAEIVSRTRFTWLEG
jgi:hypothetical protein